MGKILILDEITANKIAAGEVVERPASIVKELVENSIDANADNVYVEIQNGGISYIKVVDNGDGLSCDDLEVAFERHSTSKIKRVEDLDHISCFGFRGEALASISSVSRVIMTSRERGSELGNEISIDGGKILNVRTASCNHGTTIKINDIFFNVPARFKFLKTDSTEASHINDILTKLALANPSVAIKYISNRRNVFKTPGNNDLLSVIYSLYGKDVSENMKQVDFSDNGYMVKGYISDYSLFKRNRDTQHIFVNNRYIRSRLFNAAIDKAYEEFLVKPRYPIVFLNISMNPALVDINVHPQKLEARFSDERAVFSLIFSSLKDALIENPKYEVEPKKQNNFSVQQKPDKYNKVFTELITDRSITQIDISTPILSKESEIQESPDTVSFVEYIKDSIIIGQAFKTYIILEKEDKLILMDQHAAHERINYENILEMRKRGEKLTQYLLEPYTFDLSNQEMIIINNNTSLLAEVGYEIEEFGENTVMVRGIPSTSVNSNIKDTFFKILDQIRKHDYEPTDENIALLACRISLKANNKLQNIEIQKLLEMLTKTQNPLHCPHGRTIFHITNKRDIEKIFQRVL